MGAKEYAGSLIPGATTDFHLFDKLVSKKLGSSGEAVG